MKIHMVSVVMGVLGLTLASCGTFRNAEQPIQVLHITSTLDWATQSARFVPATGKGKRPLLVFLHTWSANYEQDFPEWRVEAVRRNWHFLESDFRGPNIRPEACASPVARQDVLDAVDYVCERFAVDTEQIYLTGVSGGGHMTLVMAAHAPERWAAASSWCPISDLAIWHAECLAVGLKYAGDVEAVVGGAPGSSTDVDEELVYRSPLHHLAAAKGLPLDINAGIHDGHTGSVPIHHTLDAFNAIARALMTQGVGHDEIETLSQEKLLDTKEEQDETYGRVIHLRRYAGNARVTIFEGKHEGIAKAAFAFFDSVQAKRTARN